MAILWEETHSEFGIDQDSVRCKSRVIVACDGCGKQSEKRLDHYKNYLRKHGDLYQCNQCVKNTAEYRAKVSATMKAHWQEDEFRAAAMETRQSQEYRAQASEAAKKKWQDSDYVDKIKVTNATPEQFAIRSERSKQMWAHPEFRVWYEKTSKERNQKISNSMKSVWLDDEYRTNAYAAMATQAGRISNIQLQLYQYLDDLNIPYEREGPATHISRYHMPFDCLVYAQNGHKNLLIECQGDYWHGPEKPKQAAHDRSKFTHIDRYFPDYEIMYIWEHEFSEKDRVLDRIKCKLGIEIPTVEFDFCDIQMKLAPAEDYRSFLDAYHYIGKDRGGKCYGAYLNGKLIACTVFSSPVRQNLSDKFGEFVELSRFCIHPSYHKKNFATWFISRCIKSIDTNTVVAYADTTVGHTGTIYKAANFQFSHEVPPDYWYFSSDGYVVRKKKLYSKAVKMSMTEKEYADAYGYTKRYGGKKLCFVYNR